MLKMMLVYVITRLCYYQNVTDMGSRNDSQILQTVTYRWQRYHPALQTGHYLSVKSKQRREDVPVFFGQSSLDGACGLHVLCMVLVILDLAKHDALENMSRRKFGVPAQVWSAFRHTFFEGVSPTEFCSIINKALMLPLSLTLRQAKEAELDIWTVEHCMKGELLAVSFVSTKNQRTNHWALCVGVEGQQIGRDALIDTLLLLDPSASTPSFSVFNARLKLSQDGSKARKLNQQQRLSESNKSRPIHWQYESPDFDSEPVKLTAAVRIRRTS